MKAVTVLSIFLLSLLVISADYKLNSGESRAVETFVGKVVLLKGQASKYLPDIDQEYAVTVGQKVYEKDVIRTEEKSFVKIEMVDDTVLSLGPKSSFEFKNFKMKSKKERNSVYNLIKGRLRAVIKHKAKEGELVVESRNVALGIRGTEFLMNSREVSGHTISQVALLEGKLNLLNKLNSKKRRVKTGEDVLIVGDPQNKVAAERTRPIGAEKLEFLKGTGIDAKKNFRPFLEYAKLDLSSFGGAASTSRAPEHEFSSSAQQDDSTSRANGWKDKLKRLNEALEDDSDDY